MRSSSAGWLWCAVDGPALVSGLGSGMVLPTLAEAASEPSTRLPKCREARIPWNRGFESHPATTGATAVIVLVDA